MENVWLTAASAFTTTAASEIGDRSFFTATILALRFPKWVVFVATCAALCVQSLCAATAGSILQHYAVLHDHREWAIWLAAVLFGVFALQHAYEAYSCHHSACRQGESVAAPTAIATDFGAPLLQPPIRQMSRRSSWAEDLESQYTTASEEDAREMSKPASKVRREDGAPVYVQFSITACGRCSGESSP